jgi:hypothetical protein
MRALLLLAVFVAVEASAGTRETTVTGIVVDAGGQPVPQALVGFTFRERHFTADGAEHIVVGMDAQAGRNGKFEFTTTERLSELMIRADSPDLKHTGRLEHIRKSGNVVVVR